VELNAAAAPQAPELPAEAARPPVPPVEALPLLELLDRDGQVRQTQRLAGWPLAIGRALDNHLPLSDPHVAPHHLRIDNGPDGLVLHALASRNGVAVGKRRLRAGESCALDAAGAPLEIGIGRTRLRLRLPGQALADEVPLAASLPGSRRFGPVLAAGALVFAGLSFNTWLESDPETFWRALGAMLLSALFAIAVWCGLWALLSKTFTRQAHFGWHLKVMLFASVVWLALSVVPDLFAFALSWPWVSDFSFVAAYAVIATALYFHLLAVEPARPRLLRAVAGAGFVAAVVLALWFNQQRSGRYGAELYMSHLFPPALRVARPIPVDRFVDKLAPLQAQLDKKAKETPLDGGGDDDGEE